MSRFVSYFGVVGLIALGQAPAYAHDISHAECLEGAEFVRNAALSRDAGATREFFMNKMAEDLALIQSFPPELRWFVQDAQDEELLAEAVASVFDEPLQPEQHEERFVNQCIRITASAADKLI